MTEHTARQSAPASEDVMPTTVSVAMRKSPVVASRKVSGRLATPTGRSWRRTLAQPILVLALLFSVTSGFVVADSSGADAYTTYQTRINYCFGYKPSPYSAWSVASTNATVQTQLWTNSGWVTVLTQFNVACSTVYAWYGDAYYRLVYRSSGMSGYRQIHTPYYGGTVNTGWINTYPSG